MPKIVFVDTYYPQAASAICASVPGFSSMAYQERLSAVMLASFGTSDFVSSSLRPLGWDAEDVVGNCREVQSAWRTPLPPDGRLWRVAEEQVRAARPDVVFMQDLSFFPPDRVAALARDGILMAAQCSCPWPSDERVRGFRLVFTSFPHYVARISALGVRAVPLRLAFSPEAASRAGAAAERDIPVSFVGGFGRHWSRVVQDFDALAAAVPEFRWWGYGADALPPGSALRRAYMGEAWGTAMYRVYSRSRVVLNRHGEIALRCGNNLRQYEATGMGALLVTDCVGETGTEWANFEPGRECLVYRSPDELVSFVRQATTGAFSQVAMAGRDRTTAEHTYGNRAGRISAALHEEMEKP